MKLLTIKDLYTIAEDDHNKKILNGLNIEVNSGEIHVIMGPNGSGKSTLAHTCFSSYKYIKTKGSIKFNNKEITNLKTDEIARLGLFMSHQQPEVIPGISLATYLKTIKKANSDNFNLFEFYKEVESILKKLELKESILKREFNVGFSGGEKKKIEILQMLLLNPKLVILDETDSGLDVDAIKVVSKGIKLFKNDNNACIIITHNTKIIDDLDVDKVHILIDGKIVDSGNKTLAEKIEKEGYSNYINENK